MTAKRLALFALALTGGGFTTAGTADASTTSATAQRPRTPPAATNPYRHRDVAVPNGRRVGRAR